MSYLLWNMFKCVFSGAGVALLLLCPIMAESEIIPAFLSDPLFADDSPASETRLGSLLLNLKGDRCEGLVLTQPLALEIAVEFALCHSPEVRNSWSATKAQVAQVGIAKSAYLPTISARSDWNKDHSASIFEGIPALDTTNRLSYKSQVISLSWTLYDSGDRGAVYTNAAKLLVSARADHEQVLQRVFANCARDYYGLVVAQASAKAAAQNEKTALETFKVAAAQVEGGVAAISDQLQAQTEYAKARLSSLKALGNLQSSRGILASDMGVPIDSVIEVNDALSASHLPPATSESLKDLLVIAEQRPSVRAARARVEAAMARVDQEKAQGLPVVNLVARASRNNQPQSIAVGVPLIPASARDRFVGIQISFPIFEGFARIYQIDRAKALFEVEQSKLDLEMQSVERDVWNSFQIFQTSEPGLDATADLLSSAEKAFVAAEKRYEAGVSNVLELLNVQAALATARQLRVQAISEWHAARLQLAASVGRLTLDDAR